VLIRASTSHRYACGSEVDAGHEFLEAGTTGGAAARHPQVGIDDQNVAGLPAERASTLGERVLEPTALLMIEHLLRAGLAGVDDGLASEMGRLDEFGRDH
jgi:hypothetical protein